MMLRIVYQLAPSSDGTHLYDNVDADADIYVAVVD